MQTIETNEMITVCTEPKRKFYAEACFYAFWFIQMVCKGLGMMAGSKVYLVLSLVSFAFLGIKYLLTDWDFQSLVISACVLFVSGLSYILSDYMACFLACLAICGAKDIDLKKLFLFTFYVRGACFIFTISASILNLFGFSFQFRGARQNTFEIFHVLTEVLPQYLKDGDKPLSFLFEKRTYYRYALGYGEPNLAHSNYMVIVLLYVVARENKLNIFEYAGIALGNLIMNHWTFSRTSLYLIFFVLILSLVLNVNFVKKALYFFGTYVFVILLVVTVVLAYTYQSYTEEPTLWQQICQKLDSIFSSRPSLSAYAAKQYEIYYIFGTRFRNGWNQLDSAYMNYWLRFGLVLCLFNMYGYTKRMDDYRKEDNVSMFLMLFVMAVFGFTEMAFYSVTTNFFILTLRDVMYPPRKRVYPQSSYGRELWKKGCNHGKKLIAKVCKR